MLPNEDDIRAEIAETLKAQLDFARRLLTFAASMDLRPLKIRGLTSQTFRLAIAFHAKACKQFRAVLACIEVGCQGEAEILMRALWETLLSLNFVLRPRFTPYAWQETAAGIKRRVKKDRAIPRQRRAYMCLAFHMLQTRKNLRRISETPKLKHPSKRSKSSADAELAELEQTLGATTLKALSHSKTCAGMSTFDLAVSLGPDIQAIHALYYGDQSQRVHATDIFQHIDHDRETGRPYVVWHVELNETRMTLSVATSLFYGCLECLKDCLGFGVSVTTALAGFGRASDDHSYASDPDGH